MFEYETIKYIKSNKLIWRTFYFRRPQFSLFTTSSAVVATDPKWFVPVHE